MPTTEQLLYQTEKSHHQRFSIKTQFLKFFAIFTGKYLCEIFKNTHFEEHVHMAHSKQSFTQNLAYMLSTHSCEPT